MHFNQVFGILLLIGVARAQLLRQILLSLDESAKLANKPVKRPIEPSTVNVEEPVKPSVESKPAILASGPNKPSSVANVEESKPNGMLMPVKKPSAPAKPEKKPIESSIFQSSPGGIERPGKPRPNEPSSMNWFHESIFNHKVDPLREMMLMNEAADDGIDVGGSPFTRVQVNPFARVPNKQANQNALLQAIITRIVINSLVTPLPRKPYFQPTFPY